MPLAKLIKWVLRTRAETWAVAGKILAGRNAILTVCAAIEAAQWLTDTDLSDNDLRASGTISLCKALMMSRNPVQRLVLDRNNMARIELIYTKKEWFSNLQDSKDQGSEDTLRRPFAFCQPWPLSDALLPSTGSARFSDTSAAQELGDVALAKTHLRCLSLEGNHLGDNGVAQLVYMLARNGAHRLQLTSINLSSNNIIMSSRTLTRRVSVQIRTSRHSN